MKVLLENKMCIFGVRAATPTIIPKANFLGIKALHAKTLQRVSNLTVLHGTKLINDLSGEVVHVRHDWLGVRQISGLGGLVRFWKG